VRVGWSIAREIVSTLVSPVAPHVAPPSALLSKTRENVLAKRIVGVTGSMRRSRTPVLVRPVALQLIPPSVLLKSPESVPAYTVLGIGGSIAGSIATEYVRSVRIWLHVAPPSTLLNVPLAPPA